MTDYKLSEFPPKVLQTLDTVLTKEIRQVSAALEYSRSKAEEVGDSQMLFDIVIDKERELMDVATALTAVRTTIQNQKVLQN